MIGYGIDYSGQKIHDTTAKDGMEQPVGYRVPLIAPSGMAFYTGKLFPSWDGSVFTGALAGKMLVRLSLNGSAVTGEERLLQDLNERIRVSGRPRRRTVARRQFGRADPRVTPAAK